MRRVSAPPPTPYPQVNRVLYLLKQRAYAVLGSQLVGMYLNGSLASGDFDALRSDIDFVMVTQTVLTDELFAALEAMHRGILASGLKWAAKLEGAYVPVELLRHHQADAPACPTLNEGQFYLARLGSDWVIQRHVLRTQGIVLSGAPLSELIDPVKPEEIKASVCAYLREWWQPMLEEPNRMTGFSRLECDEYQAYALLSMCRALYTLSTGEVASKPVSARWAQEMLEPRWRDLIAAALEWRRGMEMGRMEEVKELIQLTLLQGRNV
jgi:hypothetical protein